MDAQGDTPSPYTEPTQQLVPEIYVASVAASIRFYTSLGFHLAWEVPDYFAQLTWENSLLFLKAKPSKDPPPASAGGNIRIMVPDVDAVHEHCQRLQYHVTQAIGDRKFVLRDFVVTDPDGFEVRFGSFLPGRGRQEQEGPDHELVIKHI